MVASSSTDYKLYVNQADGYTLNYESYTSGTLDNTTWASGSTIRLGSGSFTGSFQEFRAFSVIPSIREFNNHSRFIRSFNVGNTISASYDSLLVR